MKKIFSLVTALSLFAFVAFPAFAKVDRVTGPWELTAPQAITFTCGGGSYPHTLLNVDMLSGGDFEGDGWYNTNHSYTWDIEGEITGDGVTFTLVYTGTNPGYTLHGEGTIAPDGSISGSTDGNCTAFAMGAGSATRFEGNHGQYVSSQENKQEAAQSRIGMPEQSNGHVVEE
jgi:hypothetical protein